MVPATTGSRAAYTKELPMSAELKATEGPLNETELQQFVELVRHQGERSGNGN